MNSNVYISEDSMIDFADMLRKRTQIYNKMSFPDDFISMFRQAKFLSSYTYLSKNHLQKFIEGSMLSSYFFTKRVSYIRSNLFQNCSTIRTIYAPSCTLIDQHAFEDCINLENVYLPMCNSIPYKAFFKCLNLQSIEMPQCKEVYDFAFAGEQPEDYDVIEFDNEDTMALHYVSLPACESIGSQAFACCFSLDTVYLPMLSSIKSYAFCNCSINELFLSNCLEIDYNAFYSAEIWSMYFLGSIPVSINYNAFSSTYIYDFYVRPSLVDYYYDHCSYLYYGHLYSL